MNRTGLEHINSVLDTTFSHLEELCQNRGELTGVPSGFIDLDRKTSSFQNSDLILVAARPAMGKTSFVLNIAVNAALRGFPLRSSALRCQGLSLLTEFCHWSQW